MAKNHPGKSSSKKPQHDPLQDLGLEPEAFELVSNDPVVRTFLVAQHQGKVDKVKLQNFRRYIEGKKFPDKPELLQKIANDALQKAESAGPPAQPSASNPAGTQARPNRNSPQQQRQAGNQGRRGQTRSANPRGGASDPATLGQPFHNPYTFIPFPSRTPKRDTPTFRTADELPGERDQRRTGILDLEVRTISPLMTCNPEAVQGKKDEHQTFEAMTYGNDVILPATGVRGSLRSLMTILSAGTLDYVDEHLFLIQGRDMPLGPAGASGRAKAFLGRITQIGTTSKPTRIEVGECRLVDLRCLDRVAAQRGINRLDRPQGDRSQVSLWVDAPGNPRENKTGFAVHQVSSASRQQDDRHAWQVKLSGRPINNKGKCEGAFLGSGQIVDVPAKVWQDFLDRQRHAEIKKFNVGDLVWIEHVRKDAQSVDRAADIEAIHWARWARKGVNLLDFIDEKHEAVLPDAWATDGKVDTVSDLFGQVHMNPKQEGAAAAFASRIRPENLVFHDAKSQVDREHLAPLLQPHPGCVAFYRRNEKPEKISASDPLRGYKVYRNTSERGQYAPWRYDNQPVFSKNDKADDPQTKVNKTAELLREGQTGRLRIAFHAMTDAELALLLAACYVDWRLGGGKPLGLGHCRVTRARMIDEFGEVTYVFDRPAEGYPDPATLPAPWADQTAGTAPNLTAWHETQRPVEKLRYPRASEENRNKTSVGGHIWFKRHASPKKGSQGKSAGGGLQVVRYDNKILPGQILPEFQPADPHADQLYGYDLDSRDSDRRKSGNQETTYLKLEHVDRTRPPHTPHDPRSGGKGNPRKP